MEPSFGSVAVASLPPFSITFSESAPLTHVGGDDSAHSCSRLSGRCFNSYVIHTCLTNFSFDLVIVFFLPLARRTNAVVSVRRVDGGAPQCFTFHLASPINPLTAAGSVVAVRPTD